MSAADQQGRQGQQEPEDGQVSEVASMGEDEPTPIADGDAVAGYPDSESGQAQEPEPEAGPNANPHRDQDTH